MSVAVGFAERQVGLRRRAAAEPMPRSLWPGERLMEE